MWRIGSGWQEVLISVSHLDRWIETLGIIGGWAMLHRGPVAPSILPIGACPAMRAAKKPSWGIRRNATTGGV